MKKVIETTRNPNGWEYWEFPSCFASVYMSIEGLTTDRQNIITMFALVSGISHVQLDMTKEEHFMPGIRFSETRVISEYDDYVKFTMEFAGYSYERYSKDADKAVLFESIKNSINAGRPVLMSFGAHYSWCVIVGYDDQNGILFVADNAGAGNIFWKDKPSTHEDGMFLTDHWYEYMSETVFVSGKVAPTVTHDDVFRRTISIMEAMKKKGYAQHTANYLRDNANFEEYDNEKYLLLKDRIYAFIASLIDQRAWVTGYFKDISNTEQYKEKVKCLKHIAILYDMSADACWNAWRMVGAFPKKPELDGDNCAKMLLSPVYRNSIADLIELVLKIDIHIVDCLKEMLNNTFE